MHLIIVFKIKTKKTARKNRRAIIIARHFNIPFSIYKIKSKVGQHIKDTILLSEVGQVDICKTFQITFLSNTHKHFLRETMF